MRFYISPNGWYRHRREDGAAEKIKKQRIGNIRKERKDGFVEQILKGHGYHGKKRLLPSTARGKAP